MNPENSERQWKKNLIIPRLPWSRKTVRPAEIGYALSRVMMNRENLLEDANYNKIVPNYYVVELSSDNYFRNFKPIEDRLILQWRDKLVNGLTTANSRLGRKEYRFGGLLKIELRVAQELAEGEARILSQITQDFESPTEVSILDVSDARGIEVGYLGLLNGERRWRVYQGEMTIGRDESSDIYLDIPIIQEKRLVSGLHAFIRCHGSQCILIDGSPSGKPSANGTYVNSKRISTQGVALRDGDVLILAALDPARPLQDTPGVAAFRFRTARSGSSSP
jgi:hypothetical protein